MTRVFLVMVVSAMLVTLGFTQTPDAGGNMVTVNVKGCLGGSEGNYTIVEDGTGQLFKTTSSTVDLKTHLGHDVKLTGQKTAAAADNSLAVTELSMISEHCAAAAAPAVTVDPSPQTSIPPDAPATATAPAPDAAAAPATPPPATATAPAVDPAAPAATVNPTPAVAAAPAQAVTATPAVETAAPPTTVSPSTPTVTSHIVEAEPVARPSAHARKLAAKQDSADTTADAAAAATVSPSSNTVSPAVQDAATPAATAAPSAETANPPDTAAAAPAPVVTHNAGSLTLLVSFVVLVIVLGTMVPVIARWRRRKMVERDGTPNLSFTNEVGMNDIMADEASTNEAHSGRDKGAPRKIA